MYMKNTEDGELSRRVDGSESWGNEDFRLLRHKRIWLNSLFYYMLCLAHIKNSGFGFSHCD